MRYGLTNIEYLHNILVYPENTVDLNPFMDRMKKQNTFQDLTQNCEIAPILVRTKLFIKVILCASEQICSIVRYCFRSFKQL